MQRQPYSQKSKYLNLNHFNRQSESLWPLDSLFKQQLEIKSIQISPHGRTGVFFVQTQTGSFVLKCNNQAPIQQFFNKFAALVDVSVPDMRVIECYSDFFVNLVFKIEQFCQKDQMLYARLKSRLDFPFYQILQFIPSIHLTQIGQKRFQRFQLQQHKLHQIGICIGYDMIINNSDRFKFAWLSQGNINNVLIEVPEHFKYDQFQIQNRQNCNIKLGNYVFIDHAGYLLDLNNPLALKNFNTYLQKIVDLHLALIQYIRKEVQLPKPVTKLIDQIQLFTKYTLKQPQYTLIIQGIIYVTDKFLKIYEENILEQLYESLKKDEKDTKKQTLYWNQYWNKELKNIKLDYLQQYHLKLNAVYITFPEIISQIRQKVAKGISIKKRSRSSTIFVPTRKQSNLSNQSVENHSQKQNNSQLNGNGQQIYDSMNQINQNQNEPQQDQDLNGQQSNRSKRVRVMPQGLRRKKLLQKLEAFQQKNYN